jgi:hypothetical protein
MCACRDRTAADNANLATYLRAVQEADAVTRTKEIDRWRLDRAAWEATVVAPYRALHADTDRAFAAAAPALAEQLGHRGPIATRRHYAEDPRLTRGQAIARWALPVLFPSEVAELAGAPIDVVFVRRGGRWYAIAGLDTIVQQRVAALAADCAPALDRVGASRQCTQAAWEVADAALRTDRDDLAHACSLATTLCGKASP